MKSGDKMLVQGCVFTFVSYLYKDTFPLLIYMYLCICKLMHVHICVFCMIFKLCIFVFANCVLLYLQIVYYCICICDGVEILVRVWQQVYWEAVRDEHRQCTA